MPLSVDNWHQRFEIQAQWTKNTRDYIYQRAEVSKATHVLDVGCGTGVLAREMAQFEIPNVVGIDINSKYLEFAVSIAPSGRFVSADAHKMPFKNSSFDCSFCHYVLMWIGNPLAVIYEMRRVTKSSGIVIVLAEPDYGGRIDYPELLSTIKEWQTAALQNQGANPYMGRKLKALFHQAGLIDIEVGVIGGQWKDEISKETLNSEWEIIQADLATLNKNTEAITASDEIHKIDLAAWELGERIIYVPTFYAWGRVSKK